MAFDQLFYRHSLINPQSMQIHEQSAEEYLQKGFLSPITPSIQVDNNLNDYSNYSSPPAQPIIPQETNTTLQVTPQIIYGPQILPLEFMNNNQPMPPLEIKVNHQIDLLKDQPFDTQKSELIKILGLLIIGSAIEFFCACQILARFEHNLNILAAIVLPLSLVSLIIISCLGVVQIFKNFPLSGIVYLGLNLLFALVMISFSRLFPNHRDPKQDGFQFTFSDVITVAVFFQIPVNGFVTLILLFQLFFEKNQIHYAPTLICIGFISFLAGMMFPPFIVTGIFALFYGLFLLTAINQILKGRFNLKVNDVLANCNAVYHAIIVPCSK